MSTEHQHDDHTDRYDALLDAQQMFASFSRIGVCRDLQLMLMRTLHMWHSKMLSDRVRYSTHRCAQH